MILIFHQFFFLAQGLLSYHIIIIGIKCRIERFKEIVLNCVELKEANFRNQITLEDDLEFFANNLTPKIEKLNISYNGFLYEHILPLVKRCKNITELDLYRCDLDVDRFEYHDGGPEENQNSLKFLCDVRKTLGMSHFCCSIMER